VYRCVVTESACGVAGAGMGTIKKAKTTYFLGDLLFLEVIDAVEKSTR
jgi:hypothetical protein